MFITTETKKEDKSDVDSQKTEREDFSAAPLNFQETLRVYQTARESIKKEVPRKRDDDSSSISERSVCSELQSCERQVIDLDQ